MSQLPPPQQPWRLAAMTLEEKVGQLIMVRYPDQDILRQMLARGHAGSFYFGMRGKSAEKVAGLLNELQSLAKVPAVVAFGSACTQCGTGLIKGNQMRLGATRSVELAYLVGKSETLEQRAYGFHIPGIPVLDVNTNPANAIINTRAFGDNVELVTELGLAMLRGIIEGRGVTCTMHFPGHGATAQDSHITTPVDDRSLEQLRALDLAPYREAFKQGLVNGLCTNHLHYAALEPGPPTPATVSCRIVSGLLREEMGYEGVAMTDSLTMKPMKDNYGIEEAAILSVAAGHDIILQDYQSDPRMTHRALVAAVRNGRIAEKQIDQSVTRVMRLKEWLGLLRDPLVELAGLRQRVATGEYRALARRVAREAVTVLENSALPLRLGTGEKCLVVANGSGVAWNEDMDITFLPTHERLFREVRRRLPQAQTFTLSPEMTAGELAAARREMATAQVVIFGLFTRVLCYHEDSVGLRPEYVTLIEEALAAGKRVVLINLGNPYLMASLPRAAAALCTYDEECPESIGAAVEAVFGEIDTAGKLPVHVSSAYPFGWGR